MFAIFVTSCDWQINNKRFIIIIIIIINVGVNMIHFADKQLVQEQTPERKADRHWT